MTDPKNETHPTSPSSGPTSTTDKQNLLSQGASKEELATIIGQIENGPYQARDFEVDGLFAFAKRCIDYGYLEGRNRTFDLILNHPSASMDDRARVQINQADQLRRKGLVTEAFDMLATIEHSGQPLLHAEYKQVIAQGNYFLFNRDRVANAEHGQNAVDAAREILEISAGEDFPPDKRGFYLQSFIGLKGATGQFDQEYIDTLRTYENEIIAQLDITTEDGARQTSEYHETVTRYYAHRGEFDKALEGHCRSFAIAPSVYHKAAGAFGAFKILLDHPDGDLDGRTLHSDGMSFLKFIRENEAELRGFQNESINRSLDEVLGLAGEHGL